MLQEIEGKEITFHAEKFPPKDAGVKSLRVENNVIEGTNFLDVLNIKIGAKVQLIHNVDNIDNLTNGQWGRVIDFLLKPVKCVIVKWDDENVGKTQRRNHPILSNRYQNQNGTPVFYEEIKFSLKNNPGLTGRLRQMPLKLSWASTIHKLQVSY